VSLPNTVPLAVPPSADHIAGLDAADGDDAAADAELVAAGAAGQQGAAEIAADGHATGATGNQRVGLPR